VPPPDGEPAIFMRQRDDEALSGGSTPGDVLELWALTVDWTTPASSSFVQLPSLPIADFDLTLCGIGSAWPACPSPTPPRSSTPSASRSTSPCTTATWGTTRPWSAPSPPTWTAQTTPPSGGSSCARWGRGPGPSTRRG
jgi:hypothetical protein